jgi:hypothetical protein
MHERNRRRQGRRTPAAGLLLGIAALLLPTGDARAAGAVGIHTWDGDVPAAVVDAVGESAPSSGVAGLGSSMAGNPALGGSAWAHTGAFWSIQLGDLPEVRIRVAARDPGAFSPGVSVWAIGDAAFDGGTTGFGGEISNATFGTPHSFNAFSPLGSSGTLWMQDGQGGNAKELLGVAMSGPTYAGATGWGETIAQGAFDRSVTDDYVASVSGSVGAGLAELALHDVAAGWYLIYVGGTNHAQESGGLFDLSVVAVPEPGTALLVLGGVGLLAGGRRASER